VPGYEDLNDHDHLRRDPVHGLICGKNDPLGQDRILERDKGKALAGHSTLNRLELSAQAIDARYCKKVRIIVRADSGFARDVIMSWCEDNAVFYCFGLARNDRLGEQLKSNFEGLRVQMKEGKIESPCRSYTEFEYSTLNSWTRARRVIGKAEILPKGDNLIWPRKRVQAVAQFWLLLDKCKGLVTLSWFLLFFDILVCFNPITIRCAQGRNPA
jgi:hypothetical protein